MRGTFNRIIIELPWDLEVSESNRVLNPLREALHEAIRNHFQGYVTAGAALVAPCGRYDTREAAQRLEAEVATILSQRVTT